MQWLAVQVEPQAELGLAMLEEEVMATEEGAVEVTAVVVEAMEMAA